MKSRPRLRLQLMSPLHHIRLALNLSRLLHDTRTSTDDNSVSYDAQTDFILRIPDAYDRIAS